MSDDADQPSSNSAERIVDRLNVLVGMPLIDCWRAADMQVFGFGSQHQAQTRTGELVENARHRLHVQSPWRLVTAERVAFSRGNLTEPADPSIGGVPIAGYCDVSYRLVARPAAAFRPSEESPAATG